MRCYVVLIPERYYRVLLYGDRIGALIQRGDHTSFRFDSTYLDDRDRSLLGLWLEEHLHEPYSAALRLPPWFSNLLPEGMLRRWIAEARHVSTDREMELLAQVGHDLPGAVQVVPVESAGAGWEWDRGAVPSAGTRVSSPSIWRFSLAGVALKFSMLADGDRLTVPAQEDRGDWLVKFPDHRFEGVPVNEYTMMSLAKAVGIAVPDVRLVHRDELCGLPERMWPNQEQFAFAVRRFDRCRDSARTPIHIEDFAQVRNKYPDGKYVGSYETVAALAYRGRDVDGLREMVRRLAFSILIGNGDAHLKNWSLIYSDRRVPTLSPAYDLVSTFHYRDPHDGPEDLALKLDGSRRFEAVTRASFQRLEDRIRHRLGLADGGLTDVAGETVRLVKDHWPSVSDHLVALPELRKALTRWISERVRSLSR